MKTLKILFSLHVALALIGQPISYASATEIPQGQKQGIVNLKPDPNSELIIDNVTIDYSKDDTFTVSGEGTNIKGSFIAFDIYFDFDRGTYLTELLDKSELEEIASQLQNPVNIDRLLPKSFDAEKMVPRGIRPGQYVAEIWVETLDPVDLLLARTKNYLRWSVSSSGSVAYLAFYDTCISYTTPPPYNTHWFVNYCPNSSPYYPALGTVENDTYGDYINWDFLDPNNSTSAMHNIITKGYNDGSCYYQLSAGASGEASFLLHHQRVVHSCPSGM